MCCEHCEIALLQETKASEDHDADKGATDTKPKNDFQSYESTDADKISQQPFADADSVLRLKAALLCKSVRYRSKATSRGTIWSSPLVFSISLLVLVSVIFLGNIWGVINFCIAR